GRLDDILTPEEKAFLAVREPEKDTLVKFGWRYECCHVLLWALGARDELGYPDRMCDVSAMEEILWKHCDMEDFVASAKLRPKEEILDAADLVLRYDWACVEARIHRREMPAGLDGGVVMEWHYALNWLTGANGGADWDDISTNT
ncbi:MAG: DUF4272 domain-containing protein, partial [Clostridiales Family XIII bacterium]|nr:DUF4272 domain-containing protein [Clostridiales Family XIII bacterium]